MGFFVSVLFIFLICTECFWNHAASRRRSQLEGSSLEAGWSEEWTGSGKIKMEAMEGEERWVALKERNADFNHCVAVFALPKQFNVSPFRSHRLR